MLMTSSPLQWQKTAPTRDQADAFLAEQIERRLAATDANDMLYAFDSSRDYDPSPGLEKITAPVLAINSADDEVNPPELGLIEQLMPRVRNGRYVLIPTSEETRGHGTRSLPAVWGSHLEVFLKALAPGKQQTLRPTATAPAADSTPIRGHLSGAGAACVILR
jgi:homoserine O-acetyltransferase